MDVVEEADLNEEDLQKKHRNERKELQAKIQSLKKTAPKGDKKKKKEITDTIAKLEKELEEKHAKELETINKPTTTTATVAEPSSDSTTDVPLVNSEEVDEEEPESNQKISRAQRRRNKKIQEEKERDKRISQQEVQNRKGPRVVELNSIKETLKNFNLELYNIPADGNCLYCAVNHQLETTGRETSSVSELRKLTANFIRDNKDEFIPFMYSESDEAVSEQQFEEYCSDVENTKFWGGQMELKALSGVLKCPIKVIQASGPTTIQGENFEGPPLIITYHRHLYKLGEHYNSTIAINEDVGEGDM